MKKLGAFLVLAIVSAVIFFSGPAQSQGRKGKFLRSPNKIQNRYIVVFDDSVVGEKGLYSISPYIAEDMAAGYRGKMTHVFQHAINGFATEMSEEDAEALSQDFRVKYVEEDGVMTADATQNNPPWGIDRIDQRNRPLRATCTYNFTGSGVRAYVIDTGLRITHNQFGVRASNVCDSFGGSGADCTGAGPHVAVTIRKHIRCKKRAHYFVEFAFSTVDLVALQA